MNDAQIITAENIALCCCSCNASKGKKELSLWLKSDYCRSKAIDETTVAPIVQLAIADGR